MTQPNGLVLSLFTPDGKTAWRKERATIWGLNLNEYFKSKPLDPELLFAGQYLDQESGLAYNRFRYYDPETGNYLSSDPIGLQGGETPYFYVFNTLDWIDPFGLSKCHLKGSLGRNRAKYDIERNGYSIVGEEVTMRVNGSRVRADFVAIDKKGNFHIFEAKNGNSKLTPNQAKTNVYNINNPSNTANHLGGGQILSSKGWQSQFTLATRNNSKIQNIGTNENTYSATFHTLVY